VALQPAILVLMSLPVCGVFVFLALVSFTLAASVKRVTVTAEGVAVSERGWVTADDRSWRGRLAATFRSSHWRAAPGDYTRIEQQLQPHRSSDGPDYDEHRLVLKHRGDALRDVVLSRAFHARHIDTVKTHYADLLRVAACECSTLRSCASTRPNEALPMKTLLVLVTSTLGSAVGWWLGTPGGLFGSFVLSVVGLGVGIWYGARLAERFAP
jgi:hypothetical protein